MSATEKKSDDLRAMSAAEQAYLDLVEWRKCEQVASAMETAGRCQCCKTREAEPMHTCPFKDEIRDDRETLCNCCDDCQDECRMEI